VGGCFDVLDSGATVSANSDISAFADGLKTSCAEYRVAGQDHRSALQAPIGTIAGGVRDVPGSGLRDLFLAEIPLHRGIEWFVYFISICLPS
jgi:hypothetical protein